MRRDGDVTHHAEMVAMSAAQKMLGTRSLDDCTLYSTIEPCAMCAYAIRECRIGRVIFGLESPVMGGHSRWNVLKDSGLSSLMPEVFAPPPYVLAGCLCHEVRKLFRSQYPIAWRVIESRGIFVAQEGHRGGRRHRRTGAAVETAIGELDAQPDIRPALAGVVDNARLPCWWPGLGAARYEGTSSTRMSRPWTHTPCRWSPAVRLTPLIKSS